MNLDRETVETCVRHVVRGDYELHVVQNPEKRGSFRVRLVNSFDVDVEDTPHAPSKQIQSIQEQVQNGLREMVGDAIRHDEYATVRERVMESIEKKIDSLYEQLLLKDRLQLASSVSAVAYWLKNGMRNECLDR